MYRTLETRGSISEQGMSRKPNVSVPTPRLSPARTEQVLAELQRVLESHVFRASRRCQSLLRSITEHTITGDVDCLKERALGVEVFSRPPDYDTGQDPIVRASAAEVRKKLAQYYQETGHGSETRIELLPGSYLAEFHFIQEKPVPAVATPQHDRPHRLMAVAACIAVGVSLTLAAILARWDWRRASLNDLWAPVLKSPSTVLVCVGLQAAYNLRSAEAQDAIQGVIASIPAAANRPIQDDDLILLRDRYVALDDALCLVRITSLLERYQKPYRIRVERSTSFADLRDTPAVLIGAFDNPWTLRTAGQLRFTFSKDSEHDIGMVRDSEHPNQSEWRLTNYWPNWDVPVDYAIVTRMVDTTTDRPVIIAAGLTQYGTIGAGEFITNPEYFSEAARQLPAKWQKRNLQIVLRVPVVNRISGRPRILATYLW
jgi:hypothetical protein